MESYTPSRIIKHQLLTCEGKRELGHIFKDGSVPCRDNGVPSVINLKGLDEPQEVFFCDWAVLLPSQQVALLRYLRKKHNAPGHQINNYISKTGYFPIRSKFIVFAMDARFVMG